MHAVDIGLNSHAGIQVHADLALRAFLGRDDNHTVRRTASVDRSGSGVFQHLNTLDVVGVQLMHTRGRRHTVDDVERGGRGVERTHTTDLHTCRTGRITVGGDVQTRHFALQRLHRVVLLLLLKVFGGDGTDCTRQIRLALRRVTGHDYLFQHLAVFR